MSIIDPLVQQAEAANERYQLGVTGRYYYNQFDPDYQRGLEDGGYLIVDGFPVRKNQMNSGSGGYSAQSAGPVELWPSVTTFALFGAIGGAGYAWLKLGASTWEPIVPWVIKGAILGALFGAAVYVVAVILRIAIWVLTWVAKVAMVLAAIAGVIVLLKELLTKH